MRIPPAEAPVVFIGVIPRFFKLSPVRIFHFTLAPFQKSSTQDVQIWLGKRTRGKAIPVGFISSLRGE